MADGGHIENGWHSILITKMNIQMCNTTNLTSIGSTHLCHRFGHQNIVIAIFNMAAIRHLELCEMLKGTQRVYVEFLIWGT